MPRQSKDWFWKCEPEKVLSDRDLALIRMTDGSWDEGLACVGLAWYMLCIMHGAPRRGYLMDSNTRPLTNEALGLLVRRSTATVAKIHAELISREVFSVDSNGFTYSRGMVKRESLRKKRSKSGSKGGLSRSVLLKQKAKQTLEEKVKQSLAITITLALNSSSFPDNESRLFFLAQKAAEQGGSDKTDLWNATIGDLVRAGFSPEDIATDLDARQEKTEPPWEFKKRLMRQKPPDDGVARELADMAAKEKKT